MHPQIVGRGHRILMLEEFIEYVRGHDGVSFETMREVAAAWKAANPLLAPS
jgi:hypothetical protein